MRTTSQAAYHTGSGLYTVFRQKEPSPVSTGNIVDSVANGFIHPSFKNKMDELELKKTSLQEVIFDEKIKRSKNCPSLDEIETVLRKNKDLKQKSLDEQKKVIQTYVRKVLVFDDTIEIKYIVDVDTNGGGGAYHFKSTIDITAYRHDRGLLV
jgi:site-specific DNA recombinase